jgi:hypothetical protein
MKMPGQMGESDPALPYEKMTLQYDECTRVEENKSIEVKEYLRKIKNHGCGGVPRSQPDPECADAGDAGLSKMRVHTRGETKPMALPGWWIVHVLVLGGIAVAVGILVLAGGG